MTTDKKLRPTPTQIDNLCEKFDAAKMEADLAGQQLSTAKGELQSELSRLAKPKVFGMLFERKVKHTLKKDAASTLKVEIGGFDLDTQKRLLGLFATCFSAETKAPALSVDLAAALRQKEAEAEAKAEAKAAKAAAKAAKAAKKGGR